MIKTVEQWMNRFYKPVKDAKGWTDKQCFQHILKKFSGVTQQVKRTFGEDLVSNHRTIYELNGNKKEFHFDSSTCSLCKKYLNMRKSFAFEQCAKCPIAKAGKRCGSDWDNFDPWNAFSNTGNPNKMIQLMKKMILQCNSKGEWKPKLKK